MMTNLFSMFDPSTSYKSMSWIIMLMTVLISVKNLNNKMNKKLKAIQLMKMHILKEIKELMKEKDLKGFSNFMSSLFMAIMMLNLVAIFPFNFASTAHMSISLTISLMVWMSLMINAFMNSFKDTLIHLTPMGTPSALMNFMVMIEIVSISIRPVTLSVRLTANMVAGHLLMSLLSNFSLMSYFNKMFSTIPMMVLISLEMVVAIIQSYVITILVTLYYKETL